jgi:hypothetical protein
MSKMLEKGKIILSGKNGEDFLNFFKETADLVASKE